MSNAIPRHMMSPLSTSHLLLALLTTLSRPPTVNIASSVPQYRTMSSQTIPSLTSWAQTHLAELYESPKESDLHSTFSSTFSNKAEIYTNHLPVRLDALEEKISTKKGAATKSTVEWKDIIEVPAEEGDKAHEVRVSIAKNERLTAALTNKQTTLSLSKAGIVAGFAIVTRSLKFRIRAAPAHTHTYITFNAK